MPDRTPALDWDGDVPRSTRFDDIYFSPTDGLAESRHVFLDGVGVPDRWLDRQRFCIAETGFGTGLNFLATWDAWRRSEATERLTFISVEGYPLAPDDLARAHAAFPELADLSNALRAAYPERHPGFHERRFEGGRVRLLLLFGDAAAMLDQVAGSVDGWYLDGFAPNRNREMWSDDVFKSVARLAAPGCRLATFSVAGAVRRGLRDFGFEMTKAAGFGDKRESLRGVWPDDGPPATTAFQPWFAAPPPLSAGARVAVIGGGISGAASARALRDDGFAVTLFERNPALAAESSGNSIGILQPRVVAGADVDRDFHAPAYLTAVDLLDRLAAEGHPVWQGQRGILRLAQTDTLAARYARFADRALYSPAHMRAVTAAEAGALCGQPVRRGGLWFPKAGSVNPRAIVSALLDGIICRVGTGPVHPVAGEGHWQIHDAAGKVLTWADAVVLCGGAALDGFPLDISRGQISHIDPLGAPGPALSYGGYVAASNADGLQVCGATFDPWPPDDGSYRDLRDADHRRNLDDLRAVMPDVTPRVQGGRAALRASSADHLPLVGPVPDRPTYGAAYQGLRDGKRLAYPPAAYRPGLYVLGGLGARGFLGAPLAARLLAATMSGEVLPLSRTVVEGLHPGRFMIRDLRREKL